jgi:hypothetical protein
MTQACGWPWIAAGATAAAHLPPAAPLRCQPSIAILLPFPAGGNVVSVLFSALIGGFALGQAAPNLQYFAQGKAAGGRIFQIMHRQPDIDLDGDGEWRGLAVWWLCW